MEPEEEFIETSPYNSLLEICYVYTVYSIIAIGLICNFITTYLIVRRKLMNIKQNILFLNWIIWDDAAGILLKVTIIYKNFDTEYIEVDEYIKLLSFPIFFVVCSEFMSTLFMMICTSKRLMISNRISLKRIIITSYAILVLIIVRKITSNSALILDSSLLIVIGIMFLVFIIEDICSVCGCCRDEINEEIRLFQNCGRFTVYFRCLNFISYVLHSKLHYELLRYICLVQLLIPLFILLCILKYDDKYKICFFDLIRCNLRNNYVDNPVVFTNYIDDVDIISYNNDNRFTKTEKESSEHVNIHPDICYI